ncbi:PKD-like family lipoprotein [Solitalea lacus]|uniref:PKD-like family lipoprotein n=1 Tax=Solitalea lacus TaxID=2911172 RepID=UPI001EDA71C3|nr:PKD-like family lipoprotein [Solitalea lacus]UKJ08566.1 hypothetical protein L2B55_05225 [Solitalea lacus]
MKKIYTIAGAAMALLAISCSKDLGNYDFNPKEVISIEGVANSYTVISGSEKITIDPTLSSTYGSSKFDCFWGIYESNVTGFNIQKLDTLSKTKTLDYFVTQKPSDWTLVFCAKNKETGFAQYKRIPLKVTTPSAGGWYVLKDDGSQSDIDLFKTPTSIMPASKQENIFSLYNGKKMEGKATFLNYIVDYKSFESGVLAATKTLFAGTDKDLSAVSIYSFKEIRNLGGMFYDKPSLMVPGFLMYPSPSNTDYFLLNNGQLHGLSAIVANTGLFGGRKLADAANTPYKLSKYSTTGPSSTAFFFDDLSSSFFSGTALANTLTPMVDIGPSQGKPQTAMSAKNNNKRLLFMDGSYAYFQDKTNANMKILSSLTLNASAFKMVNDTVKTTDKIFNATNFALLQPGDENMIYFANGNEVWSRNLTNKQEIRQFIVPADEVITFIKHRKFTGTGIDAPYSYNYVMIGTKIGGNYKVRMFKKSSGNLNTAPEFTLDGTGSVGDVYFLR